MLTAQSNRSYRLLALGFIGLLGAYFTSFHEAHGSAPKFVVVCGSLLFLICLFTLSRGKTSGIEFAAGIRPAPTAIVSSAFLLISIFTTRSIVHGISGILGCGLLLILWSLPNSRWTQLPYFAVVIPALCRMSWSPLKEFANIPPTILLIMLALWMVVSYFVFHWLDRRRPVVN